MHARFYGAAPLIQCVLAAASILLQPEAAAQAWKPQKHVEIVGSAGAGGSGWLK